MTVDELRQLLDEASANGLGNVTVLMHGLVSVRSWHACSHVYCHQAGKICSIILSNEEV